MGVEIDIPNYSTFSRRAAGLQIDLGYLRSSKSIDLVVDASGLKVYGEGEWKVRTHGKDKRRTWRKLHISVDAATQEIVAVSLTPSNVHDSLEMKNLLPKDIDVKDVAADKAYDNRHAYDPIAAKQAKATIPPRSGAALTKKPSPGMRLRNNNIREKWKWGAKLWKQGRKYHKRSLVETAFCRYKKTFGERMQTKTLANQTVEVRLKSKILNGLTHLGMPKSIKIS
jgi:IS5 family transposase